MSVHDFVMAEPQGDRIWPAVAAIAVLGALAGWAWWRALWCDQ